MEQTVAPVVQIIAAMEPVKVHLSIIQNMLYNIPQKFFSGILFLFLRIPVVCE